MAQVNVLPASIYYKLNNRPKLTHVDQALLSYDRKHIPLRGTAIISCTYNKTKYELLFYIVDSLGLPIIGYPSCIHMSLLTMKCSYRYNICEKRQKSESKKPIQKNLTTPIYIN